MHNIVAPVKGYKMGLVCPILQQILRNSDHIRRHLHLQQ